MIPRGERRYGKEIAKKGRQSRKAIKAFVGLRFTPETASLIKQTIRFGTRYGWGRGARKRAKMELRGTYRRRCQWKIERAAKSMERVGGYLLRFLETPDFRPFMMKKPPIVCISSTPMTQEESSKFKQAWKEAMRESAPMGLISSRSNYDPA